MFSREVGIDIRAAELEIQMPEVMFLDIGDYCPALLACLRRFFMPAAMFTDVRSPNLASHAEAWFWPKDQFFEIAPST